MNTNKELFEQVKANHAALKGCGRHNFKLVDNPNPFKWKCERCGGMVDNLCHTWYERGVKDGTTSDGTTPDF